MSVIDRLLRQMARDPWLQRAFLAFTVGMFLSCSAKMAGAQVVDRAVRPAAGPARAARLPRIQMRTLANGSRVAVLEDHEIPAVSVTALVEIPSLLEPVGKEGTAAFTNAMLREGTTTRTAEALLEAFADLGNSVAPTGFYTITKNVDRSLELMAEQLLTPAFPQASLDRLKANTLTNLRRQREQPAYIASRIFAAVVYGPGHPYTRTTTESSVSALTRDDLVAFHDRYYRPQNTSFVVAGDITPDQAVARLERVFGGWQRTGEKAMADVTTPLGPKQTAIYLYDRPGSAQSHVVVGHLGPRRDSPEYFPLALANIALGGAFNSRLNLNLRERHGFTYGASSGFSYRRVPELGTFTAGASVHTAKTDSALIEIMSELRGLRGARPLTPEELAFAKSGVTKGLPLAFETVPQIAGGAANILTDNLPLDYYDTIVSKVQAVSIADAVAAAQRHIDPERMAIVIVGDRAGIERALAATGLAQVVVVDEQGAPVSGTR
jgi:zinc protease